MITKIQKKFLRSLAHDRKTIIWVGQQGLSDNVLQEIDAALDHHELIKVKLRTGGRDLRDTLIKTICEQTRAEPVQTIGNVLTVYRKNSKTPVIKLPR